MNGTAAPPLPELELFIPVRNGADFIGACMDSMLQQTHRAWRLTVVDNCSTDDTPQIVAQYASDPRIRYLRNPEDLGAIGNFNRCLDLVEAPHYAILSHDDFFNAPTALEEALAVLKDHPEVGVVYSDVAWVDAQGGPIAEKRMPFRGRTAGPELSRRCLVEGRNHFGVPVLLRTSAVRGVRYDPAYPLTGDVDFSIACMNRAPAAFLPSAAIAIRFHGGNGTMRRFGDTAAEFASLARKHGLHLGPLEQAAFRVHNVLNTLKKHLFFFYLDHLRGQGAPRKVLAFMTVGALNTVLGVVLYGLFLRLGAPFPVASGLSLGAGILMGFQAHRHLVFRRPGRFTRYVLVWLTIYLMANGLIWVLKPWTGAFLAGVVLMPVNAVAAFIALKRLVFTDRD